MKDKKGTTITNAFQKILDGSNRKPNKIWVNKGSGFYNRSVKSRIEKKKKNAIEMYSIHHKEKFVVAERFTRTLKNKIYKYMTSVSKMYILINQMIINKLINATTQIIEPNYRILVKYTLNIHKIHILWEKKKCTKNVG